MEPDYPRKALHYALTATHRLVGHFCQGVTQQQADYVHDPSQFTLREVIAHLADWEGIWLERSQRMVYETNPVLGNIDEETLARVNNYKTIDIDTSLARFRQGRSRLVDFLVPQTDEGLSRTAIHAAQGTITLSTLIRLIMSHDTYHIAQLHHFDTVWFTIMTTAATMHPRLDSID